MRACAAIKGDGTRCKAIALTHNDYCHAHAPDRAGRRSRAASKAGKSGRAPSELSEVKAELRRIADAAPAAEKTSGYGVAVSALNVLIRSIEQERRERETEEFAARLEAVEQKIGGGRAG